MKSLLLALGLALCYVAQAEWKVVITTNQENLGRWMTTAVACNSRDTLEQIRGMPAFIADLSRPQEDVFSILAYIPMPDGCKNVTYQFRKGEDGKYHGASDDTKVTVESVKAYGEFIMTVINVEDHFRTSSLHGRKVTQDPEILQKFKEECKKLGYSEDEIVILNPTVKCQ
uniref:Lipocalin n=1 Tax=Dispholidus typus TaxID=46295 RepID=I0BWR4_DISTY|nr:lipocalin [Dispholidus typus]